MHKLHTEQLLKCSIDEAWDFFTDPLNLSRITPKKMNFRILGEVPNKTYAGQIINYKVSPLLGIPIGWTTEIKHWVHQKMFIDEQRFGPYSFWYHIHTFTETKDGVLMTDEVHYKLPLGFLGRILNTVFVKHELKSIFDYRFKFVEETFNKK